VMAGRGLGVGLVIQPLLTGMLGGLPKRELAHANTLFNVGQRLGGSVGVSLLATLFSIRVADHVTAALGPSAGSQSHVGSLADVPVAVRSTVASAVLGGFHDTIWAAAAVAALGVIGALLLRVPRTAPASEPSSAAVAPSSTVDVA